MRLAPDIAIQKWLEALDDLPQSFDWDRGNREKTGKHGLGPEEVESLLRAPMVFAGRIIEPFHAEPRWLLLGRSASGRRVALIFTRRGERLRPISCRPMRRKEREIYEEALQQEAGTNGSGGP
jgi:uncharacterized DUF497 family protein